MSREWHALLDGNSPRFVQDVVTNSSASFNEPHNPVAGFRDAHALSINTSDQVSGPSISYDGTMLFFCDRPRGWQGGTPPRTGGQGGSDLWVTLRLRHPDGSFGPWDEPQNLRLLNTVVNDFCPWISADGNVLRYTSGGRPTERVFREVPLAAFACSESPLEAVREIRPVETVRVHHEERPTWTPGHDYSVTRRLSEFRDDSKYCGPANVVVIEESPPAGWAPLGVSPGGEVTAEGTIRWTLRRGECGSASFPEVLSYTVNAGDEPELAICER